MINLVWLDNISISLTVSGLLADSTRFPTLLLRLLFVRTWILSSYGSISFSTFRTSSFDRLSKLIVAPKTSSPEKEKGHWDQGFCFLLFTQSKRWSQPWMKVNDSSNKQAVFNYYVLLRKPSKAIHKRKQRGLLYRTFPQSLIGWVTAVDAGYN